ncbi:MAG TPA: hypothetical protein VN706_04195 [Gemmatimonadaceae bacterium]|nr:hypothetical protein [Gemmatimonadaceae bacterium]
MKKAEAVENLDKAGETIGELYQRAWATALYPTEHGWGASIASAAMIPVLSAASIGQLVTSAVAKQLPEDVYDTISNIGNSKKP